jgi:hypothetical protein
MIRELAGAASVSLVRWEPWAVGGADQTAALLLCGAGLWCHEVFLLLCLHGREPPQPCQSALRAGAGAMGPARRGWCRTRAVPASGQVPAAHGASGRGSRRLGAQRGRAPSGEALTSRLTDWTCARRRRPRLLRSRGGRAASSPCRQLTMRRRSACGSVAVRLAASQGSGRAGTGRARPARRRTRTHDAVPACRSAGTTDSCGVAANRSNRSAGPANVLEHVGGAQTGRRSSAGKGTPTPT